jgi:signal transduction histidine kinase
MASLLLALAIAAAIGFGAALVILVPRRTRRFAHLSRVHSIAEKILASTAEAELAALLQAEAGSVFGAADVLLYRYRRHRRILEPIRAGLPPIELPDPSALLPSGWVGPTGTPLLPLRANGQLLGAIELRDPAWSSRQTGLVQHLCVIVAAALQAQEQQQVREHLRRTEQLAMAGQISAAIVTELREPIREIQMKAEALLERPADSATAQDIRRIVRHASETAATLERLVGFARTDQNEITTIELNSLLRGLLHLRDSTHRTRGFEVRPAWSREPVFVEGVRAQLEEALLHLLFHAEQAGDWLHLSSRETGGVALLRFEFTNPETQAELPLCRSLLRAHGGELTVSDEGFVVELPTVAAPAVRPPVPLSSNRGTNPLTILVIEPDESSQRRLLTGLGEAGHRVVPVNSAEEAVDLLRRIPFDAVFCSTRLSGMKWLDFFETTRAQLRAFILVVEDFDGSPRGEGIRVLRKQWEPPELLTSLAEATQALPVA